MAKGNITMKKCYDQPHVQATLLTAMPVMQAASPAVVSGANKLNPDAVTEEVW